MRKLKAKRKPRAKPEPNRTIPMATAEDRLLAAVFFVCLAVIPLGAYIYTRMVSDPGLLLPSALVSPFAVIGLLVCVKGRRFLFVALLILAGAAMLVLNVNVVWILALCYITLGVIGVAAIVSVLQRLLFYRVVCSVEYLNVKERLTLWDRAVAFMFNISGDIDTRNITMDYNLRRASFPWGEMWSTIKLAFMIGMFIWIYICMNPSWMGFDSYAGVPVYLFSVMLYIPVLVMPFSVFMSLNVRIETRYRDFTLYQGIKETLKRMAIPIFAAFIFILVAVNENGLQDVTYFILLSLFFNLFINGVSCLVYYRYFESTVVDEIVSKWRVFRPVDLMLEVDSDRGPGLAGIPDAPKREERPAGRLRFPD